jgi:hypothetical protein
MGVDAETRAQLGVCWVAAHLHACMPRQTTTSMRSPSGCDSLLMCQLLALALATAATLACWCEIAVERGCGAAEVAHVRPVGTMPGVKQHMISTLHMNHGSLPQPQHRPKLMAARCWNVLQNNPCMQKQKYATSTFKGARPSGSYDAAWSRLSYLSMVEVGPAVRQVAGSDRS